MGDILLLQSAWELSWDQINVQDKIARGGGGVVYKANMQGLAVACKEIFGTENEDLCAQAEVKWMQRARHPRLVMFMGCGRAPSGNIFIALEFMDCGDLLHKFIETRESGTPLSWRMRLELLQDVCGGMNYIHTVLCSIHRDLKSENVMLSMENGTLRAKVGDFGLSRILPSGTTARRS